MAFVLDDVALDGAPASGRAYCTLHYDDVPPVLFDGAQVRFEGRVYLPDGKSGEPHMDFALWRRQSGQSFGIAAYQGIAVLNGEADAPVRDVAYREMCIRDSPWPGSSGTKVWAPISWSFPPITCC